MQAQTEQVLGKDASVELACLELHGCVYGIEVSQVREVVRAGALTPLPRAPTLIEGVIDLRGTAIPVVDLGRALGSAAIDSAVARVAVLEVDGLCFGLRVGDAVDVLSVSPDALQEPPELAVQAGYRTVRAVVYRDDGPPVLVLSLEHLIERILASAPADEARS